MASVLRNPADVVNAALDRVGYKKNVGSLYDGSEQAAAALAIYGQTRDDTRSGSWGKNLDPYFPRQAGHNKRI